MKKSLNNKRNLITDDQISNLTRIYGNFKDGEEAEVAVDLKARRKEVRVVSRIFRTKDFGFLKVTVERPFV